MGRTGRLLLLLDTQCQCGPLIAGHGFCNHTMFLPTLHVEMYQMIYLRSAVAIPGWPCCTTQP